MDYLIIERKMSNLLKSMAITFAMYSKLPVKNFNWKEENMKYCLLFLPVVGIVEGICLILFVMFFNKIGINPFLNAALITVLPIIYTGGIHMDGFLDTLDALASNQKREKRLEILKDSHSGAFAIIGGIIYFLLYFASIISFKDITQIYILGISYMLIRAYSALSLLVFNNARGSGLAYEFSGRSALYINRIVLLIFIVLGSISMMYIDLHSGILCAISVFLVFLYYRVKSFEEFGGITGDLAGYFLQLSELFIVLILAISR